MAKKQKKDTQPQASIDDIIPGFKEEYKKRYMAAREIFEETRKAYLQSLITRFNEETEKREIPHTPQTIQNLIDSYTHEITNSVLGFNRGNLFEQYRAALATYDKQGRPDLNQPMITGQALAIRDFIKYLEKEKQSFSNDGNAQQLDEVLNSGLHPFREQPETYAEDWAMVEKSKKEHYELLINNYKSATRKRGTPHTPETIQELIGEYTTSITKTEIGWPRGMQYSSALYEYDRNRYNIAVPYVLGQALARREFIEYLKLEKHKLEGIDADAKFAETSTSQQTQIKDQILILLCLQDAGVLELSKINPDKDKQATLISHLLYRGTESIRKKLSSLYSYDKFEKKELERVRNYFAEIGAKSVVDKLDRAISKKN